MQALVAVMRKLLHAIYGMFKHDQRFDGLKFYALRQESASAPVPEPKEVLCP
jgi:transposase